MSTKVRATPGKTKNRLMDPVVIRAYMCAYGIKYNVLPAAVMAVGHIESRLGNREFREGPIGKKPYYGPMGLVLPIMNIERNIEVGAKVLARYGPVTDEVSLKRVLRKYNAEFNRPYWKEIKKAVRKYTNRVS